MRQKVLMLSFFFSLLACISFAQSGIRVTVLEKDTRQFVFAYVNVYSGTNRSFQTTEYTDEKGTATILPQEYPCTIEVTALGYEPFSETFYRQPANAIVTVFLTKRFSSMNEVVVTGNTTPVKMKDALSAYQVISKEQIQSMGAVTLNEALRNQLNIQLSNDNVLGTSLQMQGQSSNKVKILVDGIPLNGREGGAINLSQINMNNVERIEMVQGPMSVVYGTDALGGVINVITKKDNKPLGVTAGVYYETVGRYNQDASVSFKLGERSHFTAGGAHNLFTGWKNIKDTITYNGRMLVSDRELFFKPNEQYVANLAYSYTAKSGFKLHAASDFLKEKVTNKQNPGSWDPFGSSSQDEYYRTTRSMNRVGLSGHIGKNGQWQSQNGYNIYYRTRNTWNVDMTTLNSTLNEGTGMQDTSRFDDVTSRSSYTNKAGILTYTAGYDINLSYAESQKIPGNSTQISDYALFTNLSAPVVKDKLTTQVGLRAAHNTAYKAPVVPSFNLLYTPVKKLQVRASYAQGFRAPSLKELYLSFIDLNHHITGNSDLKAETSQHIQASASYQAYEQQANYVQFILTGYYNDVQNGIVLIPTYPDDPFSIDYYYGNMLRQRNTIGSLQVDGQWEDLHFQLGYSRTFTLKQASLYDGFNTGEATATVQYNWRKPGVSINIINKLYEGRPRILTGVDGMPTYNGHQKGYNMLDLTAEKTLWNKKLKLIAGVKNVLNVTQVNVTGAVVSSSAHGSGGGPGGFLPRSLFVNARISLD